MKKHGQFLIAYHRLLLIIMLLWLGYNFLGFLLSLVIHIPDALWAAAGLILFVISGYFSFRYVVTKFIINTPDPSQEPIST
jgi:hypothetical protein